jgi:hypothetical protein
VISTQGARACFFGSWRNKRLAAFLSRAIRHLRLSRMAIDRNLAIANMGQSPPIRGGFIQSVRPPSDYFLTLTVPLVGDAGGLLPSVMHDAASVKVLGHGKWIQREESRCGVRDQGQRC